MTVHERRVAFVFVPSVEGPRRERERERESERLHLGSRQLLEKKDEGHEGGDPRVTGPSFGKVGQMKQSDHIHS